MEQMTGTVDLRSDTVTRPGPGMRQAIAGAEVGDDVFGDDPTVLALQEKVAGILGKEAALFVPSGTMSNGIAVKVHTRPGDEMIVESGCHQFNFETGSAAVLSGVQVYAIPGVRGVITADQVKSIYKSQTFPTTGFGVVYNLKPELQEKIKEAFFTFPWEGSDLKAEFQKEDKFVSIHHKSDWAVIRKIDAANGVSYDCK